MAAKQTSSLLYQLAGNIVIILLMAAAFWIFYVRLMQPPGHGVMIDRMIFSAGNEMPAVSTDDGILRKLPDDWLSTPNTVRHGWYSTSIDIDITDSDERLAIYIPVIQMNAEVYINGILLAKTPPMTGTGNLADPLAREVHRPFYASFARQFIDGGTNLLQVHVSAFKPGSGLLGAVYIGPDRQLRPYYDRRITARVTTVQIISACMLTIAIFMSVLWWLRKQDSVYGWFALLVYAWTLRNLLLLGYDTPLPAAAEDWLALTLLGWFIVFMVVCTHRYLDMRPARMENAVFLLAGAGSVALAVSFAWDLNPVLMHRIWSTAALLLGSYALVRVALAYRYRDDLKNPFVPAGGLSILLLGSHDWLVVMGLVPRDAGLLLHFSAPVTLITFASLLLERFTGVLREAESLNLELEARVAQKHDELEANFKKLREMENRQILAEERERFMREMHDGVGGHLVSMLSMMRCGESDTGKITRAIEAALSDLRIMIDSLDPDEHDIPALLGAMRSRLEPQLAHSGMKFDWQVSEMPPIPGFGPRKALQVMRIIQEAITNVINHADATLIHIHARVETDHDGNQNAVIDVFDNGKGFSPKTARGYGLNNMERRAADINASLDITSRDPGTRVRLSLSYAAQTTGDIY